MVINSELRLAVHRHSRWMVLCIAYHLSVSQILATDESETREAIAGELNAETEPFYEAQGKYSIPNDSFTTQETGAPHQTSALQELILIRNGVVMLTWASFMIFGAILWNTLTRNVKM